MNFTVHTTSNRGYTPEELADRALTKLLYISEDADPVVKAQALVYKERVRSLLEFYLHEAVKSYKLTLTAKLVSKGHANLADIISEI